MTDHYSLRDLNALMTRRCPFGPDCPVCIEREHRPRDSARQGVGDAATRDAAPEPAPDTPPPEEALSRGELWLIVGVLLGVALWCWRG